MVGFSIKEINVNKIPIYINDEKETIVLADDATKLEAELFKNAVITQKSFPGLSQIFITAYYALAAYRKTVTFMDTLLSVKKDLIGKNEYEKTLIKAVKDSIAIMKDAEGAIK
jgi:hypothetical protein